MSKLPDAITELASTLSSLPGIGPKMANRLAVYLATSGQNTAQNMKQSLTEVEQKVVVCKTCGNLSDADECDICLDASRDRQLLMVVETPMDLIQIDQTGEYNGRYIVIGRLISPINGVGPGDINIDKFTAFLTAGGITEVILALSPTVEGEATSLYLTNLVKQSSPEVSVSRLARGLPTGVGIEYLDRETLKGALEGRRQFVG